MKKEDLKALPALTLPYASLRLEEDEQGNLKVFDPLRNKLVALTPEEFVRQNFIEWLSSELGYPKSHIANEVKVLLNGMPKRSDTIVYGHDGSPLLIIEYKAPTVEITQDTFDQIVRYNMELKARYLVVSNGLNHYCCKIDYSTRSYNFIRKIPPYLEAIGMPGVN